MLKINSRLKPYLLVIIIVVILFLGLLIFMFLDNANKSVGGECTKNSDCKIIDNNCGCAAVPVSDPRTRLQDTLNGQPIELDCFTYYCPGTRAVCSRGKCVVK